MVEALDGEKEFKLVFEGSDEALNELKEAWEDAPVTVVSGNEENIVVIAYDESTLKTEITINDNPFDTSRINGKEIEDWIYPFLIRKIKWNGIFEELASVLNSEEYTIRFSGNNTAMKNLMEECPDTVQILKEKNSRKITSATSDSSANQHIVEKVVPSTLSYQMEKPQEIKPVQKSRVQQYPETSISEEVRRLKNRADSGNAEAQLILGDCYRLGKGVTQNYEEALKYYTKSAEQGNAYAQFEVGCCFYHGEGIRANRNAALEFYFNSAELGNKAARDMLEFLSHQSDDTAYELFEQLTPLSSKTIEESYEQSDSAYFAPTRYTNNTDISATYNSSSEIDTKRAVKFGVKVAAGVAKIAGILSAQPEITAAASAIENVLNGIMSDTEE